ncbi:MAG: hypothetical protein ACMUIP_15765 [bacterium]
MREGKNLKGVISIIAALSILLFSGITCTAQGLFGNPFYNVGFSLSPIPPFPYPLYNPAYPSLAPVAPVALTAPVLTTPPVAAVSALSTIIDPSAITTIAGVILADWLINTGNPQVKSVLLLIALDPSLLDNPWLLNTLINTGNPDVWAALLWLQAAI